MTEESFQLKNAYGRISMQAAKPMNLLNQDAAKCVFDAKGGKKLIN